jgi:poly(3-hydroxybutyrate) depolymerase
MRMLLKISMPAEQGNEAARNGALQRTIQSTMEALKPEAAYFYPEDGKRTAIMVFEMHGSWQLPATVEPLFQTLGASVHLTPVMNGEDLQRGFKEAGM